MISEDLLSFDPTSVPTLTELVEQNSEEKLEKFNHSVSKFREKVVTQEKRRVNGGG